MRPVGRVPDAGIGARPVQGREPQYLGRCHFSIFVFQLAKQHQSTPRMPQHQVREPGPILSRLAAVLPVPTMGVGQVRHALLKVLLQFQ